MAEIESNNPDMAKPAMQVPESPAASPATVVPVRPRRRRRLVLKVVGAMVVLIVFLVLALPTVVSSGPVRSIIVGQINDRLNGKVEVASLSLGWFSGVKVQGVRVFDVQGAQIAEVDHLTVPFPLWKVVTGKFALGESTIDGLSFDAKYDQNGKLNFAQLVKSAPGGTAPASSPGPAGTTVKDESRLPDLSGDFKIVNCRGTVSRFGQPTLYLTSLEGEVKIPDINQPISDQLNAIVRVGNQPDGSISLSGTASAIKKNQVALDSADVHQNLTATNIDLQSLRPFLPPSIQTLDGTIGLQFSADLTGGKDALLDLAITASKPVAIGGPALSGDTFRTDSLLIQLPKVTAAFPDGAGHWQSGRIKTAGVGSAVSSPITVKIDQGQVTILADLTAQSILNLMDNKKPAAPGLLTLASTFDLAKAFPQLTHLIPQQPGTKITSGGLAETVMLSMTPDSAVLAEHTASTRINGTRTSTKGPAESISIDPVDVSLDATDLGGGGVLPELEKMDLKISSKSANGEFRGQTLSSLNGTLTINLNVLRDELSQILDLQNQSLSGSIVIKMSEEGDLVQSPFKTHANITLIASQLHYANPVTHQKLDQPLVLVETNADLQGSAKQTVEKIQKLLVTLKTGDAGDAASPALASLALTDAALATGADSMLNQFNSGHFELDVPSIKPVMELVDSLSAPLPVKTVEKNAGAPQPIPALRYTGGAIAVTGDLAREGSKLKLTVAKAAATGIAFQRGAIAYVAKPISANLLISIDVGPGKSTMEQIRQIDVQQLNGDLGIATLSMPTPITISQLVSHPVANGSIKFVGNLTDLTKFLTAYQGKKPDAMPYRGDYALTENIGSNQGMLALKGGLQIAKLQSFNGSVTTFSEDLFTLSNDIALTPAGDDESMTINELSAEMQSSGALHLELKNGIVGKLHAERNLQLQPSLDYDLAKLWPVIEPMMGEQYKTLKITGHFKKQFNITGSYPAGQPSTVAIKTLHADGDLAVATFDYNGLNLQNVVVPFALDRGKLVTVYANKPEGQNTAPPAVANGGTLDLSNWMIDLTQDPPRLNIPANKLIVSRLTVNPLFSKTFLANYLDNPLFAGADQATGLLDFTAVDCIELPLGDLVTQAVAANTGKAHLKFSLTNMNIGLQGISGLQKLLKDQSFTANVKDGTVAVAKGISTQHISFASGNYSLDFDGPVRLSDEVFLPALNLSVGPLSQIAERATGTHDKNVLSQLPDRFLVPVTGSVHHAGIDVGKVLKQVGEIVAKATLKKAIGGNGGNANPLGGLLDQLNKKKK